MSESRAGDSRRSSMCGEVKDEETVSRFLDGGWSLDMPGQGPTRPPGCPSPCRQEVAEGDHPPRRPSSRRLLLAPRKKESGSDRLSKRGKCLHRCRHEADGKASGKNLSRNAGPYQADRPHRSL